MCDGLIFIGIAEVITPVEPVNISVAPCFVVVVCVCVRALAEGT